jgi:hypothetical protein
VLHCRRNGLGVVLVVGDQGLQVAELFAKQGVTESPGATRGASAKTTMHECDSTPANPARS